MTSATVSVIIVSRGRPEALKLCLTGIEQLFFTEFEVVVVADPDGCEAVRSMGFGTGLKLVEFDTPNISAARNTGARNSSGEILAFIDDDAVPEPDWLDQLVGPFSNENVQIAGGFVLGRDGLNFQYQARWVDRTGWAHPMELTGDSTAVFVPKSERAIKTEGTNFAIRHSALDSLGGFDEAFEYFLDETDINIRVSNVGMSTAIAPNALVHHGFLASDQRTAKSLPKTLFDIGASAAVFLRKHASDMDFATEISRYRAHQAELLKRHVDRGNCSALESDKILQTFDDGVEAGQVRPFGAQANSTSPANSIAHFEPRRNFQDSILIAGRSWNRNKLRRRARQLVDSGNRVTLMLLEPSPRRHQMRFDPSGYWEQFGGLFGQARDGEAKFTLVSFRRRVTKEFERIKSHRKLRLGR